ncbi:protein DCL homolog, chloroplastic [Vigna unguiculata]|uniref:protein DCL homolog, chloroplastic n=1 Tax=Vigna unguiculata TaxID=3917 RepID=UPI001016CA38|nr:protein DCL homolog, chloroplastic [Vigna unguiculata]
MAAPLLLRQALLLRVCFHNDQRFTAGAVAARHRPWCSVTASLSSDEADEKTKSGGISNHSFVRKAQFPTSQSRWEDDPDYRKWKDKKEEILKDIEPIIMLAKDILHSERYVDGARLNMEDEKAVVEKLLVYHPQSEDKVGCGLESIMVDRHPQYRQSRCLFVVRTDGGWIDFSYQKCLREYIRDKYPTHAERFIRRHFKRESG